MNAITMVRMLTGFGFKVKYEGNEGVDSYNY